MAILIGGAVVIQQPLPGDEVNLFLTDNYPSLAELPLSSPTALAQQPHDNSMALHPIQDSVLVKPTAHCLVNCVLVLLVNVHAH